MIKLVFCVRRKPELSVQEFRNRWKDHQTFTRNIAKAMHAVRVTHSTTLAIEENEDFRLTRGTAEPFDALMEVWWKDSGPVSEGFKNKQIQEMILRMRADQNKMVDLPRSMIFFTSEDNVEDFRQEDDA
jgi:hypothetical protein